jgi:hypothetical protein
VNARVERTGVAAGSPDGDALGTAPELPAAAPVSVVRTSRGWAVAGPADEEPVDSLIEGLTLADLVSEELGHVLEPDRSARRSARGPAAGTDAEDPKDARIAALERTVAQLEHALAARVSIERAIGVLAERDGLEPKVAFDGLRQRARSSGRPVHELAREVLDTLAAAPAADDTRRNPAAERPSVVTAVNAPRPRPSFGPRAEHTRTRSGAAGDGRS